MRKIGLNCVANAVWGRFCAFFGYFLCKNSGIIWEFMLVGIDEMILRCFFGTFYVIIVESYGNLYAKLMMK